MKTVTARRKHLSNRPYLNYPNAATYRQIIDKLVELLLMGVMGVGAAAIVLFILALS